MAKINKNQKAFTLLELLIVIAVLGILSSIILVSLSSARNKSRDAAIITEARQLGHLLGLQFIAAGSFSALQSGWDNTTAACADSFSGIYAVEARAVCVSINKKMTGGNVLYTGNNVSTATRYSVMARLSTGFYFCTGSSGRSTTQGTTSWAQGGCYANP